MSSDKQPDSPADDQTPQTDVTQPMSDPNTAPLSPEQVAANQDQQTQPYGQPVPPSGQPVPPYDQPVPPYGQPVSPQDQTAPYNQPYQQQTQAMPNPPGYDPQASQQYYAPQGSQPIPPNQGIYAPAQGNGKAMAALICGICSILFPFIGLILGIVAIVLASQYKKEFGQDGKATGGKITGIIGIILTVLWSILTVAIIAFSIAVFDEIDRNNYTRYSSNSSSLNSIYDGEDQKEVEDLAEATFDSLMSLTSAEEKELSEFLNDSFTDSFDLEGLDITLSDLGVDAKEFTSWWISDRSYTIDYVSVYTDYGIAFAEVTRVDIDDFTDILEDKAEVVFTEKTFLNSTEREVYLTLGDLIKESMDEAKMESYSVSLDFDKINGTWKVDESSYNSVKNILYGYNFS